MRRPHIQVANSQCSSGALTKEPYQVRSQDAPGMSSSFMPPCVGATHGMRIVGATPVNEGKHVDMEFADGSAFRFLSDVAADGCKTFTLMRII